MNKEIAIISMECKVPGANNILEYYENIKNNIESINFNVCNDKLSDKSSDIVNARGILDNVEYFDPSFFGYTQKQANLLDPQHRLFMECAWQVLESAGYVSPQYKGAISVYASCGKNLYLKAINYEANTPEKELSAYLSNGADFLPTKVSYKLNLRGESIAVQTGCSSSLVAVHMACQSLNSGCSDMALAGGVHISLPQKRGYQYQEGMIYSKDGHCRPFDNSANGTVESNGLGVVLLKRLDDAIKDNDFIYAVIKGSAINNDGNNKIGYTAPSIHGQSKVIEKAIAMSGVPAESIKYIETHGTGTILGDLTEFEALKKAYNIYTNKEHFCYLGSVKSNIGHTYHASGVLALIKTALVIQKGIIPGMHGFKKINRNIDLEHSQFIINSKTEKWPQDNFLRRAGVSSFGMGGTNVHMIIEQAPKLINNNNSYNSKEYIFTLSATNEKSLYIMKNLLEQTCEIYPNINMCNLSYSLNLRRTNFKYRWAAIASNKDELISAIRGNFNPNENETLRKYRDMWLDGAEINLGELFEQNDLLNIPIPTFPFEEKVCWDSNHKKIDNIKVNNSDNAKSIDNNIIYFSSDEIIKKLKEIFSKELEIDVKELSIDDDIFELGGDSLSIVSIMSECEKNFNIKISLKDAFDALTISELKDLCESLIKNKISNSNNKSHE